jgi:hypothetical protein
MEQRGGCAVRVSPSFQSLKKAAQSGSPVTSKRALNSRRAGIETRSVWIEQDAASECRLSAGRRSPIRFARDDSNHS